jgi:hypothetical protein
MAITPKRKPTKTKEHAEYDQTEQRAVPSHEKEPAEHRDCTDTNES